MRQPEGQVSGRNFGLLESPGLETVWGGPKKSPLFSLPTVKAKAVSPSPTWCFWIRLLPPLPLPGDQNFTLGQRVELARVKSKGWA